MGLLTRSRSSVPVTIDRLREEFDNALQQWWSRNGDLEPFSSSNWQPSVDVSETEDAYHVKAGLPGIEPDDVDISVTDDRLTIQGKRNEEKETKDQITERKLDEYEQ